jgi:hypothetical protein
MARTVLIFEDLPNGGANMFADPTREGFRDLIASGRPLTKAQELGLTAIAAVGKKILEESTNHAQEMQTNLGHKDFVEFVDHVQKTKNNQPDEVN